MKSVPLGVLLFIAIFHAEIGAQTLPKLPSIEELTALKTKCDNKGGEGTYQRLLNATAETKECVEGLIDLNKIEEELNEAAKTGSMDEVFGKYCKKRPQLRECINKTVSVAKECMEEKEKNALNTAADILEKLGDFACYQDGDRLAMFVAEEGPECIKASSDGIQKCFNKTLKIDQFNLSSIPDLTINKKRCEDISELQTCVVEEMEKCENSTPANIIEALFKFVKKLACKDVKTRRSIVRLKRGIRTAMNTARLYPAELLEQCEMNGGKDRLLQLLAYNILHDSVNSTLACAMRYKPLVTPKQKYSQHILNCSDKFVKGLETCLPERSKYYPKLLLDIVNAIIEFAYSHQELYKPENQRALFSCWQQLKQEEPKKRVRKCFEQTRNITPNGAFDIPPKEELCEKMKGSDTCILSIIEETCTNYEDFKNLLQEFIVAVESPCRSTSERKE